MGKIISIVNQKGGVGKTTTTINLGAALAFENKKDISLEVNELNNSAISLYKKAGFEEVGIRKKYYNGKDNAIIMTKKFTV